VIGAILARIFLKQKISIRVAAGMSVCVVGAILIGYAPPSGDVLPNFYLGLICAGIAAFGWASEGVLSVAGMAMVDPEVAINIRQITSGTVFSLVVLPIIGGYALYAQVLTTPNIMMVIAAAALAGSISFLAWYKANSSIGVAKGMALNSTFSLWGIVFPFFISGLVITTNLVIGAIAVFCGAILVVMNPMELIRKEN
jgi:drug/metabolite transporter (DMT)-like permease